MEYPTLDSTAATVNAATADASLTQCVKPFCLGAGAENVLLDNAAFLPTGAFRLDGTASLADKYFTLEQNFPNPFTDETAIPFVLKTAADVRLNVFDPLNRKVAAIGYRTLGPGNHEIPLNLRGLGLRVGEYAYELQVVTRYGTFRQRHVMMVL